MTHTLLSSVSFVSRATLPNCGSKSSKSIQLLFRIFYFVECKTTDYGTHETEEQEIESSGQKTWRKDSTWKTQAQMEG
jgi:hypothetical protein